ncbi:MAG: alpha/beta fold hydrolase, partial [Aquiluna sp.]
MRILGAVLVTGGVVLASGCQSAGVADFGAALGESDPAEISDYAAQELAWGECDPEWLMESTPGNNRFECASLDVPALYDSSTVDVSDFRIAMMRLSPESGDSLGTIFINPGGPGVSGMDQLQWSPFPDEMVANFTIIGFDPRGVGQSDFADGSEIHCSDELDLASYFEESSPGSEAELDEVAAVIDEFYDDCSTRNPYWWTLSTDNVVKDLDIMREVVTPGEPLNFIGSSYGTTIAGRYVSLFPEMVGKIVFDSPTTVDTDRIESALEGLAADEEKLRIYVQGYADNQGLTFDEAWDDVMEVKQLADDDMLYGFAGVIPVPEYEGVF